MAIPDRSITKFLIPGSDKVVRTWDPLGLVGDNISPEYLKRDEIRRLTGELTKFLKESGHPNYEIREIIRELLEIRLHKPPEEKISVPEKYNSFSGLFYLALEKALPIFITFEIFKVIINGNFDIDFDVEFQISNTVNRYNQVVINQSQEEVQSIAKEVEEIMQQSKKNRKDREK